MAPRSRVLAFGTTAAMVTAGAMCGALIGGLLGEALAIGLILAGLGGALLLVFYEVGLSEDRERARDEQRRRRRTLKQVDATGRPRSRRWPRRPR